MLGKQLQTAAAGSGAAEALGIEDVFSTYVYDGNSTARSITNGIDLSGEGGLTWIKARTNTYTHQLFDTERGANQLLQSNTTDGQIYDTGRVTSFNSDGFSVGTNNNVNSSIHTYASWTFRKAPGFFDVVTYTGTGSVQNISHNLGSVPGTIIIKSTTNTSYWPVYHRSLGAAKAAYLNVTDAAYTNNVFWNSTAPTSTQFTVGTASYLNANGQTYVAYLFAHDEQIFGESGSESVIKCGSYTGAGTNQTVNLGWEPQWVLIKNASTSGYFWSIMDSMRGIPTGSNDQKLFPNASNAESASGGISLTATGFEVDDNSFWNSGDTYIYIAIRRGPMKTPEDATEVFSVLDQAGTGAATTVTTGLVTDMFFRKCTTTAFTGFILDRLRDNAGLIPSATDAESTGITAFASGLFANNTGFAIATGGSSVNGIGNDFSTYAFRRAPGFFDVVAYTGTSVARTVEHNLGVVPELIIVKNRDYSSSWIVYAAAIGNTKNVWLDATFAATTNAHWNNTTPTSSVFSVGTLFQVNYSGAQHIAYLFASCPGVSKVGSYTGTGSTLNVDCGFSAGARFVLIKRTDSTGDWYVWDTARGIVSGNDPYLLLNTTDAENATTDYIDPYASGFTVTSTAPAALNASGGNYIFLAIA